jgi:hypothetical protein
LFGFDFLKAIEVHEQGASLGFQSRRGEMVFQPLAQDECEEQAKYVAAGRYRGYRTAVGPRSYCRTYACQYSNTTHRIAGYKLGTTHVKEN